MHILHKYQSHHQTLNGSLLEHYMYMEGQPSSIIMQVPGISHPYSSYPPGQCIISIPQSIGQKPVQVESPMGESQKLSTQGPGTRQPFSSVVSQDIWLGPQTVGHTLAHGNS